MYFASTILFSLLIALILLEMMWSRLERAWRGWRAPRDRRRDRRRARRRARRARRRMSRLQRRLVEEGEELDVCSICYAEYAAGEEVLYHPFELSQASLLQLMYPGCHPGHATHSACLTLWFDRSPHSLRSLPPSNQSFFPCSGPCLARSAGLISESCCLLI